MIEMQALTVRRGGRAILSDLTLTLRAGEVSVLIGPNGSGKSTLLTALSGALPYQGRLALNGAEVSTAAPEALANRRAVMRQHSGIAFPFSVAEVVALGARGRPAQVDRLLARVGLAGFGPRNAMALSGGEAQRMHLARALLQAETASEAPFWLMLDEPVSSLDLAHQIAVMDLARGFARKGGGVLVVLHDLNLAVRGADRLLALQDGALVADGAPAVVLTDALLAGVYDCALPVNRLPESAPFLLVQA